MGNLEFKCCFCEELAQILFYLEDMMTHMGDPESHSVSVRLPDNQSSFSQGTLIRLLTLAIATVRRCFLQSYCFKLSWPEKMMVANGNKHQLNILPKISIFP